MELTAIVFTHFLQNVLNLSVTIYVQTRNCFEIGNMPSNLQKVCKTHQLKNHAKTCCMSFTKSFVILFFLAVTVRKKIST